MKSWVLYDPVNLRLEERSVPEPKAGEVLVKVKAAGIDDGDLLGTSQDIQAAESIIAGSNFVGVVENTNDLFLQNRRVGIYPMVPCFQCEMCIKKLFTMCASKRYFGLNRDGGLAEYAAVPKRNLIDLPESIDFQTALLLKPLASAIHAVRLAKVDSSTSVAVVGLGTVGLLIMSVLKKLGIKELYIVGSGERQRKKALQFGALGGEYRDIGTKDFCTDIVFECGGMTQTMMYAINSAKTDGKVILTEMPKEDQLLTCEAMKMVRQNQLSLIGSWDSTFSGEDSDDWHEAQRFIVENGVRFPILIDKSIAFGDLASKTRTLSADNEAYDGFTAVMMQ